MYDFNPNFALIDSFSPEPASAAAHARALEGTACRWVNETSGESIEVSIAQPSSGEFGVLLAEARNGAAVGGIGDEAFFGATGGVGTVQVFSGRYWVTVSSVYFGSADDASSLLAAALSAIS